MPRFIFVSTNVVSVTVRLSMSYEPRSCSVAPKPTASRRSLIADRLLRRAPAHGHAFGFRLRGHARWRNRNRQRNEDRQIRRHAARLGAFGDDRVREADGTAVDGAQRRRIGVEQPRAGGRRAEVGLFYAVHLRAELDELRLRQLRHFREQRNRLRLRNIDVAGLQRFRIAAGGRRGKLFDVAVNGNTVDVSETAAGGGERWVTPRKEHFVGALCY